MAGLEWRMSQNADRVFREMRDQMDHPQPAFKEMLGAVAKEQVRWFATEGRGRWRPLSPRYGRWKKNAYPGRKKLHGPDFDATDPVQRKDGSWTKGRDAHEGGALRADLTRKSRTNGGNKFGIEEVNRSGFVFGTNIDYAVIHARGKGKMPRRRPIAPMGGPMMHEFETIMLRYIMPSKTTFKSAGSMLGKGSSKGKKR